VTAAEVLAEARARGVVLSAGEGGKLHWRCPGGLPAGLRNILAGHKEELLSLLKRPATELALEVEEIERRDFPGGFPPVLRRCIKLYLSGPTVPPAEGVAAWWEGARRQVMKIIATEKEIRPPT
jgi:hypothetical protein